MNYELYIALLVVFVVGVLLIKKIAGCVFRIVVCVIMLAVLAFALRYLGYI